jgi:hypothetical protein
MGNKKCFVATGVVNGMRGENRFADIRGHQRGHSRTIPVKILYFTKYFFDGVIAKFQAEGYMSNNLVIGLFCAFPVIIFFLGWYAHKASEIYRFQSPVKKRDQAETDWKP